MIKDKINKSSKRLFMIDIFDYLINFLHINKTKFYRDFIIQASISQSIRGKTHNKKNSLDLIKKITKYLILFIRLIKYNYKFSRKIVKEINRKKIIFELIIVFPDNDKWILKGISLDLEKEIKNLNINVKACPLSDINNFQFERILFIHHKVALKAIKRNYSLIEKSSIYLSHIRTINLKEIELLSKFKFIFCQSSKDQMRLYTLGVLPGRVIHLPIGFDSSLFYKFKNYDKRKYDFVLSTPLKIDSLGSHYWLRKSSYLIHDVISKIAQQNYKIMIIGDGWHNSLLQKNRNIFINNCSYKEKNKVLNDCKIFLNLSLIEGGPVTLLEAIASGCNTISKDNGISNDINLDFPKNCFNIKNILSSQDLSKTIIDIYLNHLKNENNNLYNSEILYSYSFEYLGKRLVKVLEI